MTAAELLARLRDLGIEVRSDAEALRVEAPKGAMTAELAQEIRALKPQLLEFLSHASRPGGGSSAICPREEPGPAPMSFAQQRLWYLDQLDPGSPVYNVPVALWLRAGPKPLDPALLRQSLSHLVTRHEVLRSRFRMATDGPQVEHDEPSPFPMQERNLRGLEEAERAATLHSIMGQEARRPFDLAKGPVMRALCLRTHEDAAVLMCTFHHVASDGWSQDIFQRELVASYNQLQRGQEPSLPALTVQYGDYAVWQRAHLGGAVLEQQLSYWTRTLCGALPVLDLPTDFPRPAMQPSSGDVQILNVPKELLDPVAAIARAQGATQFNALLAVYAALLARYTGQDDLIIGSPVAGRVRPEVEGLIGCFTNTLALRIDLSGQPSFRELLARVATVVRSAIENQDLPFERLVEELDPERDLSRTPIFQTLFAFEDGIASPVQAGGEGLQVEHSETVHAGVSRTDLSLWVSRDGDGLKVAAEYCDQIYGRETVRSLLAHFVGMLQAVCAAPDTAIDQLSILSKVEQDALQSRVNQPQVPIPELRGFHQLFEARAAQHPARTAVLCGEVELSYGELNARANALAGLLRGSRRALVGVCVERSVEMLVAVLAVAKAGAGYVPLDPEYPSERLAYMIADAGLQCIVADPASAAILAAIVPELQFIPVAAGAEPTEPSTPEIDPEDIAYVIYTSGSTGQPKGVEVPHRAVINFLSSMEKRPGLADDDVLLAVTTLSFDIAVLELYLPLSVGARVVIASSEQAADGNALQRLIERHGVTAMQATPSTWRLLLGAGWAGPAPKKILCGGEAFPAELLQPLCDRAEVWNMYGPTETTVWSTCSRLDPREPVHLGTPIDNTQVYVLDRSRQLVPPMVRGELYIAGAGVTRGYRDLAELTAASFVDDPFAPGGRMYATGDQAWWDHDGRLICGGRLDGQVKVRGYRIELGEIETVLARHQAVEVCAVLVREDRPGDARLVGYVVPAQGKSATVTELRAHLRGQLPDYMIVQHLVELDHLPLTPAGKLDRAALPAPETVLRAAADRVPPSTEAQEYVAKIWLEVLGIDAISVHDNFFERGGHSLLSMQVILRINRDTGADLSPRVLLLDSLEQIAARLPVTS